MTLLHQAAQKAVEALKDLLDAHARNTLYSGAGHWEQGRDAIFALEDALQQQPEPVAKPSRVGEDGWRKLAESQAALLALQEVPREPAPPNSLPTWDECALRVGNSEYIAKRVADGGYGAEPDSLLATELHRFIHEYDDADPYRSAWFLHRLELLLNEVRAASPSTTQQEAGSGFWWCAQCQCEVPPRSVTYEETHDVRAGGCGHPVGDSPAAPSTPENAQ